MPEAMAPEEIAQRRAGDRAALEDALVALASMPTAGLPPGAPVGLIAMRGALFDHLAGLARPAPLPSMARLTL